jgi:hypothetical protein
VENGSYGYGYTQMQKNKIYPVRGISPKQTATYLCQHKLVQLNHVNYEENFNRYNATHRGKY